MELSGISSELSIVVIAYLIGMVAKIAPWFRDEMIPVLVGLAGAILGVIGFYFVPGFPAQDILHALAIGIVSGLASTGVNQTYKQLICKEDKAKDNL